MELDKLSNRITYFLKMNDGCTDPMILEMMEEYKAKKAELKRSENSAW